MQTKLIFILPIVIFLLSCSSNPPKTENVNEEKKEKHDSTTVTLSEAQIKNANIVTGRAEKRNISAILKVSGKIDVPPQNIVSVSFPLGGYLKSTTLLSGMPVSRGQVIGVLEDPQYIQLQQDYLSAGIKRDLLHKEYDRQRDLNAAKASSDKVFQQIESDFQNQKVLVKALSEKLSLIGLDPAKITEDNISRSVNVVSPINGFVSKVDVNIGKYVSPTEVLFELINPQDIHLGLFVFQKDVPLLSIGQNVITYTANNPGKKYRAKIILISRDIASDGSVEVHCHFERYDKGLIPGMYMNAEIETLSQDAVTVPEEAVVLHGEKQYVFAATANNHYEMMEVQTGTAQNGFVVISSANSQALLQQDIVLKNAYALLMKMKNTEKE